jgi:nucleoid DNA-binding protein
VAAATSAGPSYEADGDVLVAAAAGPPRADEAAAAADEGEEQQKKKKRRGLTPFQFNNQVAEALGCAAKNVNAVFRATADVVSRELTAGATSVCVPLLGKFSLSVRPARGAAEKMFMGRSVMLPAREASRRLKASPARSLTDLCNAV